MRRLMILLFLPVWAAAAMGQTPELLDGVMLKADGVVIDAQADSAPTVTDWNGDGKKDLLVGSAIGDCTVGKVRVYLNQGTDEAPVFSNFTYIKSSGVDIQLPSTGG